MFGVLAPQKIKVGDVLVTQEKSAKLLGMTVDDNQKWETQIHGKGGVISNLNLHFHL